MASKPKRPASPAADNPTTDPPPPVPPRIVGAPVFAQPEPTADPTIFKVKHQSDGAAYKEIDALNKQHALTAMPFPAPRSSDSEPRLTLDEVFNKLPGATAGITKQGQIVFHALGDCGSTRGPKTETLVTDKLVSDFGEADPREVPQFCLFLGDIVYSFGEAQYYYDQFYEPYRNYAAPILAAAGNHDGMVSPLTHARSLAAFEDNFCADPKDGFVVRPEAGGLSRTAQIQPGVYFTFDAPFVRILVFYSNTLEDPGVIADKSIGNAQLDFLRAALQRVKAEKFSGALLFAHHHPPYAIGSQHSSSTEMRQQMDEICAKEGVWPHAVLAGHAHNYQRFTRLRADGTQIPYVISGNGGHNVQKIGPKGGPPLRTPQIIRPKAASDDQVTFENYDDTDYGYLRIIVDPGQLRIEYHPASDGDQAKTPDDHVTVDLKTRKFVSYTPNDMGFPRAAKEVRDEHNAYKAKLKEATAPRRRRPPIS